MRRPFKKKKRLADQFISLLDVRAAAFQSKSSLLYWVTAPLESTVRLSHSFAVSYCPPVEKIIFVVTVSTPLTALESTFPLLD